MPRAIVDPVELHRFAAALAVQIGILRDRKNSVNSNFKSLKEVWRDKKYEQFDKSFSEIMARLERFTVEAEAYAKYLRLKAQKAEKYLEGGY